MKAFITSIGEKTTEICQWQLKRLGFETVLLDEKESWFNKYQKFLELAKDEQIILRVDADIIVSHQILAEIEDLDEKFDMYQFKTYCLYKNNLIISSPVIYRKMRILSALNHINDKDFHHDRPETDVWRLNPRFAQTVDSVVGFHGFYQDRETINRARKNKITRKQDNNYDFDLAEKLLK